MKLCYIFTMKKASGVYETTKKNGETYYRSSITYQNRHISLGSYPSYEKANLAYQAADHILHEPENYSIDLLEHYYLSEQSNKVTLVKDNISILSFEKTVVLLNFRDNQLYFHSPIYLKKNFFYYYLAPDHRLTFDKDDLFYYSSHKIMQRGSHLFVADYGMQVGIASRYGIKNHAVKGRDYYFQNNDENDYRYDNIKIINRFYGVTRIGEFGQYKYRAKIHINGDIQLGTFDDEETAAIAYNKAADYCKTHGINKNFPINYLENISGKQYAETYTSITLPDYLISYCNQ